MDVKTCLNNSTLKIANLISNLNFYKLIPYPMDNCFTGRRDWSHQMTEKVIMYKLPAGLVTECTFARCRLVHTSCLDRMTSSRLFRLVHGVYRCVFYCVVKREDFQRLPFYLNFHIILTTLLLEHYGVPWPEKRYVRPRYGLV